jgi:hypothetical protein
MTKFEDQLYQQLMSEHGHQLRAQERPAPARHRARRPVWLASGAAAVVAGITAGVMALGSAPAMAAYSVTQHDGTTSVAVYNASGVAGANQALRRIGARVVVVPVHPGCRPMGSLPRPHPAPHPSIGVATGVRNGHRFVRVTIGRPGIPRGDTLILAFVGNDRPGTLSGGAGGIITGPVPHCVSLNLGTPPGGSHAGQTNSAPA